MSLNFNRRGEIIENAMITDEGLFFIEERKYTPVEMEDIRFCEKHLESIEDLYGTLNIFELMDKRISKKDMNNYLVARKRLHDLGWTGEKDIEN